MQTKLAAPLEQTPMGREAEGILRSCVHCGFCLPSCPTYRLLGDELDSPRGRIYLIKQMLEGAPVTERTQLHLDRCLTCRACETSCPSGVQYGRLLEIGRELVESRARRGLRSRVERYMLAQVLPRRKWFAASLALARRLPIILPRHLRAQLPPPRLAGSPGLTERAAGEWPATRHSRRVLLLSGCVQPTLAPAIDLAAARVFDHLGISVLRVANDGCCGAVSLHLADRDAAQRRARRNIDAFWPHISSGAEAVISTASACALMMKEYGSLLREDPKYAGRAARVSELARDASEIIAGEGLARRDALDRSASTGGRVAFHSPCTLQHGLRVQGVVEAALAAAGYKLLPGGDGQRCCGAAGTYSILQPELSSQLLDDKLAALQAGEPEAIATANIGCLIHLRSRSTVPVRHWLELLAERLTGADAA